MRKILIINGHPRKDSLDKALAVSYKRGAQKGGHDVKLINVRDLDFDPIFRDNDKQELEEDLKKAQELIKWCDHLVITTPVWWMGLPALLKGFFDRILIPGFAYRYHDPLLGYIPRWDKLLEGRSARVIYTEDGPQLLIKFFMYDSFWKTLKKSILQFNGFNPVKRTVFPRVLFSTKEQRKKWITEVFELGKKGK